MRLFNLKKVRDYDVITWLENEIPELTEYQREKIREKEIVRLAPFYFMERNKKVNNVWLRFTIVFIIPVFILLILSMPFNFFITGQWGYSEKLRWYGRWASACGC